MASNKGLGKDALVVEQTEAELAAKGVAVEGLKQDQMVDVLKDGVEAGASNGAAAETPGAADPAGNGATVMETRAPEGLPETPTAEGGTAEKTETATAEVTEVVAAPDAGTAPAAENGASATRAADEVSGGTEEPGAKKAKADAPADTPKAVETPAEAAPASEPAAATVE